MGEIKGKKRVKEKQRGNGYVTLRKKEKMKKGKNRIRQWVK